MEEPAEDTVCLERKKGEINSYKDHRKKRLQQEATVLDS